MIDDALAALMSAWYVTVAAVLLLFSALAIAPFWDAAIYFHALNEALLMNQL